MSLPPKHLDSANSVQHSQLSIRARRAVSGRPSRSPHLPIKAGPGFSSIAIAAFCAWEMFQPVVPFFFPSYPVVGTITGIGSHALGGLLLIAALSRRIPVRPALFSYIFPAIMLYMFVGGISLIFHAPGNDHFPMALAGLLSDILLVYGVYRLALTEKLTSEIMAYAGVGLTAGTVALTIFTSFNLGDFTPPFIFYSQIVLHRNAFADHGVLTALVSLIGLSTRPRKLLALVLWVGVAVGLTDALLSASKTVWGAMAVAVVLATAYRMIHSRQRILEFIVLSSVSVAGFSFVTFFVGKATRFLDEYRQEGAGSIQTRNALWDQAKQGLANPLTMLFGNGYNSPGSTLTEHGMRVYSYHNDLLNTVASSGVIGGVPMYISMWFIAAYCLLNSLKSALLSSAAVYYAYLIFRGQVEANIGLTNPTWFIFLLISATVVIAVDAKPKQRRRVITSRKPGRSQRSGYATASTEIEEPRPFR